MSDTLRPIDKFVQGRLDDSYYSPDTPVLYNNKWLPLFVYGTLRQGFSRHTLLQHCPYVGSAFTRMTGWVLYRTATQNSYPVLLPALTEQPGAVYGEVYLVSPDVVRELDFVESNGIQYHREYRTIQIHGRGDDARTMAAYMYIGNRGVWKDAITKKGLVLCDSFKRKDNSNFRYYLFKKEYNPNVSVQHM